MPQVSATYTLGNRPVAGNSAGVTSCYTDLTVSIPLGAEITDVDIAYTITANGGAWKSEQYSRVTSPTLARGETAWSQGVSNTAGAMAYSRIGVALFNGAGSGDIVFRLEAWRAWSSSGQAGLCSTVDQTITNSTYTVTVHYDLAIEADVTAEPLFGSALIAGSAATAALILCDPAFPDGITKARVVAAPLFGPLLITAETDVAAGDIVSEPLFGEARVVAARSQALLHLDSVFQPLSFRARAFPPNAEAVPSGVTRYLCMLTGAPDGRTDAILPIRSFQVRHRRATASYYQVVIPSLDYIDALEDRPNGQIVIWSDTDGVEEELMRGSLGNVRGDRGPNNQAITISGNASRAQMPRATYRVSRVLYQYSTFDGEQRLRIEPRAAIRPGDTIQFEGSFFTAGVVTWSVSVSENELSAQMEVATLAEGE